MAAESMGLKEERMTIPPQLQLRDPMIQHIGWALKAELETAAPYGRLYADGLGLSLAVHLLRRYANVAPRELTRGLTRQQLTSVLDYINANLARDLALAELAAVCNLSASHFKTLFKQSTGQPVHKYVVRRRVEYAVELLQHGGLTLSSVALQAGFTDQSHMARCLRKIIGMTPSMVVRSST
jgi:AraC family transcriptional regulator